MGKLFVIEGIDGSGKATQTGRLFDRLCAEGYSPARLSFPRYDNDSSAPIRQYLAGEYGTKPGDVNAYAASAFFAVDRYASFKQDWGEIYNNGGVVVSDRYVSSNLIHQGSKMCRDDALKFFEWLYDFEYNRFGLPKPDAVFFLNVPPDTTSAQMSKRYKGDETRRDIHEKDIAYQRACYETALFAAEKGFMTRIDCLDGDGNMQSVEAISDIIYRKVKEIL